VPEGLSSAIARSATAVVVATTDRFETERFLQLFDFDPADASRSRWAVPGGAAVAIELIDAEITGEPVRNFSCGPRALDVYTADIDRALDVASDEYWCVSSIGTISLGPVVMRQAMIEGPDGFDVVLVESTHRRSSLLDDDPRRLFSEPHSVVWCVPDRNAEAARWAAAGFTIGADLEFREPAVSDYLGLPRSPVTILMQMISGPAVEPVRLELLEFPDDRADPDGIEEGAPIRGGLHAVVFTTDDVDATAGALAIDERTGLTPGGIRVDLRQA